MNILSIKSQKVAGVGPLGVVRNFCLGDFLNKTLVLYFYPNDGTPGCTLQACDFRDNMCYLSPVSNVVGVNRESTETHRKFISNEGLNFILLSDPDKKLINFFGVWGEKPAYGLGFMGIIRSTFIIKPSGEVLKSWQNVNVEGHIEEIFEALNINPN